MKAAIIGIGSNSLRMLIAEVEKERFSRLKRYRTGLRVFDALDENKNISYDMILRACFEINSFIDEAKKDGARSFHIFATSATRDASNRMEFAKIIEEKTGLHLYICSGEEEAALSFLGAVDTQLPSGVIDIGGGSTEIALGKDTKIAQSESFQLGAVRLWKSVKLCSTADIEKTISEICTILSASKIDSFMLKDRIWTGVGGTFTTAAAFVQKCAWNNRERIHGYLLTQKHVSNAIEELLTMTLEERVECGFIQPQRADIIIHGFCILKACMIKYGIEHIRVSEFGNLEGFVKAFLLNRSFN